MEEERRALAAFVSKFDALGLGLTLPPSKLKPPMPTPGGASAAFAERQLNRERQSYASQVLPKTNEEHDSSPMRILDSVKAHQSLLEQVMLDEGEMSFDMELELEVEQMLIPNEGRLPTIPVTDKLIGSLRKVTDNPVREILGDKENLAPWAVKS